MATATKPADPHGADSGHGAMPAPNDPTHDVNGRAVVTWVLAWTAVLFAGMYGLLILFDVVLARSLKTKVEEQPPVQLIEQRKKEDAFLKGELPDGKQGRSIDQTLREMAKG